MGKFLVVLVVALVVLNLTAATAKSPQCGRQGAPGSCAPNFCCSRFGYCGQTSEYCCGGCQADCNRQFVCRSGASNLAHPNNTTDAGAAP